MNWLTAVDSAWFLDGTTASVCVLCVCLFVCLFVCLCSVCVCVCVCVHAHMCELMYFG